MTLRSRHTTRRSQLIFGFLLCLSCVATAFAQTSTKVIIQRLTIVKYPVVLSFELKGEPLKFKETVDTMEGERSLGFEADKDWLSELTVKIKNVSGKTITYIQVNLNFPEVTRNGRSASRQLFLGVDPDRKFSRPDLLLAPNEVVEVDLSKETKSLQRLVQTVSGFSLEAVTRVWVEFHAALLDDDELFQAGQYYRRNSDPSAPVKWTPIEKP